MDQLRASENRLRILLGCTKGIVFEFDHDGRYLNVWTDDESLLARPRAELLGKTIDGVLGVDRGRPFTDAVRRVIDTGAPESFEYELDVQGGHRWFSVDVVRSPAAEGWPTTAVYLVRDISERKRLEDELRRAQRMDAIGRLAAGIAHDFNNLLTTILGRAELLLASTELVPADRARVDAIASTARRAASLTGQLVAISRSQALRPQPVDVNAAARSVAAQVRRSLGPNVEVSFALAPDAGYIEADPALVPHLVMQLAEYCRPSAHLSVETARRDGHVELTLRHDGPALSPEAAARCFEPTPPDEHPSDPERFSLTAIYGLVVQSGGQISAEGRAFRARFTPCRVPA